MSKFLVFEIHHCSPVPFVLLNNDTAIKQITEREYHKDALIYFICKVKKVRFDLRTCQIQGDRVKINLIYEGHTLPADFSILDGRIPSLLESSTSKNLLFDVEGIEEPSPMAVTPDLVLRQLKGEIGNRPQIIYIGYSFDPIGRLRSHEKIVKASSEIEDNEEIRIYINSFKFSYAETFPNKQLVGLENIGIKRDKVSNATLKKYVKMVERVFIHFFQTEGLNDNHINMDIMTDPILKKLLQDSGVRFFGGGFDMEGGEYFDFWSTNQIKTEKSFFFDFKNPQLGYITFEQANKSFLEEV
jgi:hypothetical protein